MAKVRCHILGRSTELVVEVAVELVLVWETMLDEVVEAAVGVVEVTVPEESAIEVAAVPALLLVEVEEEEEDVVPACSKNPKEKRKQKKIELKSQ